MAVTELRDALNALIEQGHGELPVETEMDEVSFFRTVVGSVMKNDDGHEFVLLESD